VHVLMTTDTLGGVFTYATDLARVLAADGVRVTLAGMGGSPTPEQRTQVAQTGARWIDSSYRLEWMDDPWADVREAGDWLLGIERRSRPDLIHLNGYAHAALPWRAPVCVVAHSCVLSWWRAVLAQPAPARYDRYRDSVLRGLRAAAHVVAPSKAMLDALGREYGPLPTAEVIFNGAALEEGPVSSSRKEPMVLSAGRLWDAAKNIGTLQAAASSVAWPVYVAGDQRAPDGGTEAALCGVRWLGVLTRAELGRWMRRAAIYAAPALYEPFGLSILEAALQGCALVLGDIASLRELWKDCALFVDPRDPQALAEALNHLIADEPRRSLLGRVAAERARRYGLARMGSRYLSLYGSLLEPGRTTPRMEASS
jgi:glycogen(starch) synthase